MSKSLPLAQLMEDFAIYPRHAVDDSHVSSLLNALRSGAVLPPIVVEKKSGRIVDGWHRCRAYKRHLGPEGVVLITEKVYATEAELVLDAIAYNSTHGRKLDVVDQIRATAMCQERGISVHQVAIVLHVPEKRVERLLVRLASAPEAGPSTIPGTLQVALKHPASHLSGATLTPAQLEAHLGAPGVSYTLLATQLRVGLESNLANRADEPLVEALKLLREALEEWLT